MEDALKAYALAANYGVADVSTAATFHTAAIYQDFGQAMLKSERPKKLSRSSASSTTCCSREQTFPSRRRPSSYTRPMQKRASEGIYDKWVKQSFEALARLRRCASAKAERAEG